MKKIFVMSRVKTPEVSPKLYFEFLSLLLLFFFYSSSRATQKSLSPVRFFIHNPRRKNCRAAGRAEWTCSVLVVWFLIQYAAAAAAAVRHSVAGRLRLCIPSTLFSLSSLFSCNSNNDACKPCCWWWYTIVNLDEIALNEFVNSFISCSFAFITNVLLLEPPPPLPLPLFYLFFGPQRRGATTKSRVPACVMCRINHASGAFEEFF